MRNLRLRALAATALLSLLPLNIASGFGIGLQPTTVEIALEPGERTRQVITIANVHTEKAISLTLGLADWSLDENGQIILLPPGEMTRSAAEWVRFSPAFINLEPGKSQQVIVDMVAPARIELTGDHRFALLASTILPEERTGESGVWKKYQIASLFYLNIGPSTSEPEILSAQFVGQDGRAQSLLIEFGNPGDSHARLAGEVEVRGPSGQTITTLDISNLVVLDGASRLYSMDVGGIDAAGANIEIRLENTFAPQVNGGIDVLDPWSAAPAMMELAALSGGEVDVEADAASPGE